METSIIADASVLVAAAIHTQPGHQYAIALLKRCTSSGMTLIEPAIVIPEIVGAMARLTGRPGLARQLMAAYRRRSDFTAVPVDAALSDRAGTIAALQRVKGCDAIYLALARELALPLVTLDREQRERAPEDVEVLTPEEALAEWFST